MTRRPSGLPRPDRSLLDFLNQTTARTNAAESCARLRERRHEREDVDAYLRSLRSPASA
jgi:hypothetical protein